MGRRLFSATLALLALVGTTVAGSVLPASADPWGDGCGMGVPIANPTLAINHVAQSTDGGDNNFTGGYVVNVCRDTSNHVYIVTVSNPGQEHNVIPVADADKTFTVSFTPNAADVPLIAEGKAYIDGFSVGASPSRVVTLDLRPMAWSDIYGSDCGDAPPATCVLNATGNKASIDYPRDIMMDVRYKDATTGAGGEGFAHLTGMTWSLGAYYFWFSATCPADNGGTAAGLSFEMGGPHFMSDGTTLNSGFAKVYLPATDIVECFGGDPSTFLTTAMLSRTELGTTEIADGVDAENSDAGLNFTIESTMTPVPGVIITVPTVTFSKPTYTLGKARSATTFASIAASKHIPTSVGGYFSSVIDKKSKKICQANSSTLYGIKKGKCVVTVSSFNSSDVKLGSKKTTVTIP